MSAPAGEVQLGVAYFTYSVLHHVEQSHGPVRLTFKTSTSDPTIHRASSDTRTATSTRSTAPGLDNQ
jgi:hypothetical protein